MPAATPMPASAPPAAAAIPDRTIPKPAAVRALRMLAARRDRWPFAMWAASWAITACSSSAVSSFRIRPEWIRICWVSATKAFSELSSTTSTRMRDGLSPAARRIGADNWRSAYSISASRNRLMALAGVAAISVIAVAITRNRIHFIDLLPRSYQRFGQSIERPV